MSHPTLLSPPGRPWRRMSHETLLSPPGSPWRRLTVEQHLQILTSRMCSPTWQEWWSLPEVERQFSHNQPKWWARKDQRRRGRNEEKEEEQEQLRRKNLIMSITFLSKGQQYTVDCSEINNLVEVRKIILNQLEYDQIPDGVAFYFQVDGKVINPQQECRTHAFQLRIENSRLVLVGKDCIFKISMHGDGSGSSGSIDSSDSSDSIASSGSIDRNGVSLVRSDVSEVGIPLFIFSCDVRCVIFCLETHVLSDIRQMIPHVLHPCQMPHPREPELEIGLAGSPHRLMGMPRILYNVRYDVPFTLALNDDDDGIRLGISETILYEEEENEITVTRLIDEAMHLKLL